MVLNNAQEQNSEGELFHGCSVCRSRALGVAAGQEDEVRCQVPGCGQQAVGRQQRVVGTGHPQKATSPQDPS